MIRELIVPVILAVLPAASAAEPSLPIEQRLTPAGSQVFLPQLRPKALALSPDGRWLVCAGAADRLVVMDPASGEIRQSLPFSGAAPAEVQAQPNYILSADRKGQLSFTGLIFSPDGTRLFASDVNGRVQVFSVAADGIRPAGALRLPPADAPLRKSEIPAGLAVSHDGARLYVAGNLSNRLLELDAASGAVLRTFPVGVAPFGVVLARGKAYVSNWGGRRPGPGDLTGPAGKGTRVRVDPVRFIASEGSVSVVDLGSGRVTELPAGRHASGIAASPNERYVAVANANDDSVSIIDTRSDRLAGTFSLKWQAGDLFGASPNALCFAADGKRLFVCAGTQNAVAVVDFRPGDSKLAGLIPTGWFPGAVAYDSRRQRLDVANLKGDGREDPGPDEPNGFHTRGLEGSLSLIPIPGAAALRGDTQAVLANYRRAVVESAFLPARPEIGAVPVPERIGEPSVFRHVIYVMKENRTYDQMLGDLKPGNGDPGLCIYGENITPNLHRIARQFVLLDNTYCAGILSADGHQWGMSAIATDYLEKSFSTFPRSYPFGGAEGAVDALAYSPAGFIWDDAIAHGVTMRNYGEFMLTTPRWADGRRRRPTYADIHRAYVGNSGEIVIECRPGIGSLAKVSKLDTAGWDLDVSDQYRVDRFLEEFRGYERDGNLPSFIILYLPQDHTCGTRPGSPCPASCEADNDLAVGRVVDALSHSRYWRDTVLFAMEDDPQDGWDHVSGYRTTAYVAGAYVKRSAVVSTRYTQPGLLRTIELILGLPPMNQLDAAAIPWRDCFQERPDDTPFEAVPNRFPLDRLNPPAAAVKDPVLRRDAVVSSHLPFDQPDRCPEDVLNGILWRAQMGGAKPYPSWAVLRHPVDDDD